MVQAEVRQLTEPPRNPYSLPFHLLVSGVNVTIEEPQTILNQEVEFLANIPVKTLPYHDIKL